MRESVSISSTSSSDRVIAQTAVAAMAADQAPHSLNSSHLSKHLREFQSIQNLLGSGEWPRMWAMRTRQLRVTLLAIRNRSGFAGVRLAWGIPYMTQHQGAQDIRHLESQHIQAIRVPPRRRKVRLLQSQKLQRGLGLGLPPLHDHVGMQMTRTRFEILRQDSSLSFEILRQTLP
jgi:hypothetical protein